MNMKHTMKHILPNSLPFPEPKKKKHKNIHSRKSLYCDIFGILKTIIAFCLIFLRSANGKADIAEQRN